MPFRSSQSFQPINPGFEAFSESEQHGLQEFQADYKQASAYSRSLPQETSYQPRPIQRLARKRRSFKHAVCYLLSLFLGLAWLGPVIYLLVVNIRGDTIGASAWCPTDKECNVISYLENGNVSTAALSVKYDVDNHNLLGALQFVAKALEVWYFYIATSLIWYVTVILAKRPDGLPIGYLLTHLEFGDLRAIFDPLLYRSAGGSHVQGESGQRHKRYLYLFVVFVVFMCLMANLMGPSVAVLVLPTLNWNNGAITPNGQFNELLASQAPNGDNAIPGCVAEDFQVGNLNCSQQVYSASLDALVKAATDQINQNADLPLNPNFEQTYVAMDSAVTVEQAIPFTFNISRSTNLNKSSDTIWSFSRQTLRGLSSDFQGLYTTVLGNTTNQTLLDQYGPYNSSLQLMLQRYGPQIGMSFYGTGANLSVTQVSDNQQIRCYAGFSTATSKTKCMRTGLGWNTTTESLSFTIDKAQQVNMTVDVQAYWSDKALYLDDDNDPCFPNGTLPAGSNCDYDTKFANVPSLDEEDNTTDMFVTEWALPSAASPENVIVVEFFPAFGFATYSIDVTQIYPSLSSAMVPQPPGPSSLQSVAIHPAWYLAAWGVDNGGDVSPYGDAGFIMQDSIVENMQNPSQSGVNGYIEGERFLWTALYSMAQAASFIPYSTTPTPDDTTNLPSEKPLLWSNVYNQVWGWSTDSRTSKLGIVVAVLGAVTVLVRSILLITVRAKERSSLQILVTALEHRHQGELAHAEEETELARTRYQLLEDEDAEKMLLMPVRSGLH